MRKIEPIDSNKWLNLVNSEAHPDIKHYELNTYDLNGQYVVVLNSGYGVFISKLTNDTDLLDQLEAEVLQEFNSTKSLGEFVSDKVEKINQDNPFKLF